jgi:hypothetical protein
MYVPLYQGRTIYQDYLYAKFQGTEIYAWRRPHNSGTHCAPILRLIFECFGIQDITAQIVGQRTRASVVKCAFKLLAQAVDAKELHHNRGKVYYEEDHRRYDIVNPKAYRDQQERVKKVIADIPHRYGIRTQGPHIVPSEEEVAHMERMEDEMHEEYIQFAKKTLLQKQRQGYEFGFDPNDLNKDHPAFKSGRKHPEDLTEDEFKRQYGKLPHDYSEEEFKALVEEYELEHYDPEDYEDLENPEDLEANDVLTDADYQMAQSIADQNKNQDQD